jgi:acetyltransferase-like isoleucine patch superfamily enzyme
MIRAFITTCRRIASDTVSRILFAMADAIPPYHDSPTCEFKNRLLRRTGMSLGKPCFIDRGFRCIAPKHITLEHCVSLGHDNHIWAFTPVRIGHHTITAKDLLIISASHDASTFEPLTGQEIDIGPGCWIGARVTILGGVKIGKGCIIGAGSLVKNSLPDWSVAVGVPARVIKQRQPAEMIWNHFGYYSPKELS